MFHNNYLSGVWDCRDKFSYISVIIILSVHSDSLISYQVYISYPHNSILLPTKILLPLYDGQILFIFEMFGAFVLKIICGLIMEASHILTVWYHGINRWLVRGVYIMAGGIYPIPTLKCAISCVSNHQIQMYSGSWNVAIKMLLVGKK